MQSSDEEEDEDEDDEDNMKINTSSLGKRARTY